MAGRTDGTDAQGVLMKCRSFMIIDNWGLCPLGADPFLFAQRSWQTHSLLISDLTLFMGKRLRLARASLANGGV